MFIINATVDNDCSLSLSDHKPVICSISAITLPPSQSTQNGKPSWEKARSLNILQDYTFAVSHMLWPINIPNSDAFEIEISTFYQNIIIILKNAVLETIPIVKFNRHAKPYWSNSVKEWHAEMSYRRRLWITEGRPRGMQFPTFQMYKQAKDTFRTSLNKAYLDYERETYSSLDEACNINHKSLWAKLRSKKKINSIISINVDNNTITNPKTICNAMADHFSKVFSDTTEDHFDVKFKSYVDQRVSEFKKKAMT